MLFEMFKFKHECLVAVTKRCIPKKSNGGMLSLFTFYLKLEFINVMDVYAKLLKMDLLILQLSV